MKIHRGLIIPDEKQKAFFDALKMGVERRLGVNVYVFTVIADPFAPTDRVRVFLSIATRGTHDTVLDALGETMWWVQDKVPGLFLKKVASGPNYFDLFADGQVADAA